MADRKTEALTDSGALDGTELTHVVKAGNSRKASVSALGAAILTSPAMTGTPTAPTPATSDNSTKVSTTAYVKAAIAELISSAPTTLDTLAELADALGDDPNFATTITTLIGTKISATEKGAVGGVASLDSTSKVPAAQLPVASTTVAGAMSAADKVKLDGLSSSGNIPIKALADFGTVTPNNTTDAKAAFNAATAAGEREVWLPGNGQDTVYISAGYGVTLADLRTKNGAKIRDSSGARLPPYVSVIATPPTPGTYGIFDGDYSLVDARLTLIKATAGRDSFSSAYFDLTQVPESHQMTTFSGSSGTVGITTATITNGATSITLQSAGSGADVPAGKTMKIYDPSSGAVVWTATTGTMSGNVLQLSPAYSGSTIAVGAVARIGLRTMNAINFKELSARAQGDHYPYLSRVATYNAALKSQYHFFQTSTIANNGGTLDAYADGNFLTPFEYNRIADNGFDVGAAGVMNYHRTNNTGNRFAWWSGLRITNDGENEFPIGTTPQPTSGSMSATSTTLTDASKTWTTNQFVTANRRYNVKITSGTGAGQVRSILSNTSTVLTLEKPWTTTPDSTSKYLIGAHGVPMENGIALSGPFDVGLDLATLYADFGENGNAIGLKASSNISFDMGSEQRTQNGMLDPYPHAFSSLQNVVGTAGPTKLGVLPTDGRGMRLRMQVNGNELINFRATSIEARYPVRSFGSSGTGAYAAIDGSGATPALVIHNGTDGNVQFGRSSDSAVISAGGVSVASFGATSIFFTKDLVLSGTLDMRTAIIKRIVFGNNALLEFDGTNIRVTKNGTTWTNLT